MEVSSVSFGKVIAVSGKRRKAEYLKNEMKNTPNMTVLDASDFYLSSVTDGLLHKAARRYDSVDIYITGKDNESYKNKEEGWKTLNDVLCHIDKYYNLRTTSTQIVKEDLREDY